jgi:WD40 repeat protein
MERDDQGANQVCNPPMIHSLAWSPSGRLLAAGLGDATCGVLRVDGRKLSQVVRLREGHESSVATVLFPNWSSGASNANTHHVLAQDRLLASAGTDGAILCWDLGKSVAGNGALDPSSLFGESVVPLEDAMEQASLEDGESSLSAKILFGIPHDQKPNWMVCSGNMDQVLPATLFVADTSNDITAYTIPMR